MSGILSVFIYDSAQAPAINVTFSATGTRSIQYTSDVSAPNGDTDDWLQFTPFTQTIRIELTCTGNGLLSVEVMQNNQPLQNFACGANQAFTTSAGLAYLLHIQAAAGVDFKYTQYTLNITSMP